MSTTEKVELVEQAVLKFGLEPALAALQLSASTWYYQRHRDSYEERYRDLRKPLEQIAREHPEYGYRRTTVELREAYGLRVNQKVIRKLHRLWELPLLRSTRHPKPSGIRTVIVTAGERVNLVARLGEIRPLEVAYTDFTELVYADGRAKAQLIAMPDHDSRYVLGWAVGERANTELALQAWEASIRTLERFGRSSDGMIVHHDRDGVFTSYDWTSRLLLEDRVRLSYALNGARDNTQMESFYSRFKEENRSLLLDAQSLQALGLVVDRRMRCFNQHRRHSSVGYKAPLAYLQELC